MAHILPFPKFRALDANGDPLAGGLLYTYAAGTSTPLATYTDVSGSVANTNPVVLDGNGEASIWTGTSAYKLVLTNSSGVSQWTIDNVKQVGDGSVSTDELATGALANTTAGRTKMEDGFLSATADGLAKMAAGFLQATSDGLSKMADGFLANSAAGLAKMADGYLQATTAGRAKMADGFVTNVKLAAAVVSEGVTSFNDPGYTGASYTDAPNLAILATSIGRPIMLSLVSDGSNAGFLRALNGSGSAFIYFRIMRDSTPIFETRAGSSAAEYEFPGGLMITDLAPPAGERLYKVQYATNFGTTVYAKFLKLVAIEL